MYLKPTQALWNQIEAKIEAMFKERLVYALNWTNYGLSKIEIDKRCLASVIPAEEDVLVQQLGAKWFVSSEDMTVKINNGTNHDTLQISTKVGGRKPLISPHWNSYGDSGRPQVTDPTIVSIATRRHEAWEKVRTEQKDFVASVKEVWEDAPSINALMKIWPPIVDLLPPEIVRKLEQKTTRRTAKQMAENVDTKSLSVHILKAKVAR
jgi:hypothetical protein